MPFLKYLLLLPVTLVILLFSGAPGIASPVEPNDVPPQAQRPGINDRLGPSGGKFPEIFDPEESKHYFPVPGTNMKAGTFYYEFIEEDGREGSSRKAGFLVNDSVLYYVVSDRKKYGGGTFDPNSEFNYGIYKDYLVMDAFSFGAGHNRMMYLFRYGKDTVEILDVIKAPFVGRKERGKIALDFMSAHDEQAQEAEERNYDLTEVKDLDNDGIPEVRVWISGRQVFEPIFDLYLEIRDDKLRVDFNPELYKPLFEEVRHRSRKKREKPETYYIYGFLSGRLGIDGIRAMLKSNKDHYLSRWIIRFLESRDIWDAAFHDHYGSKPVLIRHELTEKEKKGGR